jgi:hypothetical protein
VTLLVSHHFRRVLLEVAEEHIETPDAGASDEAPSNEAAPSDEATSNQAAPSDDTASFPRRHA